MHAPSASGHGGDRLDGNVREIEAQAALDAMHEASPDIDHQPNTTSTCRAPVSLLHTEELTMAPVRTFLPVSFATLVLGSACSSPEHGGLQAWQLFFGLGLGLFSKLLTLRVNLFAIKFALGFEFH